MPSDEGVEGLPSARLGSVAALGHLLEASRGYLLHIARQQLDPALLPKGGASDVVQQTMLDAVRDFKQFHGCTRAELHAWLRHLLMNNLISFTRLYRETGKRAIKREVALRHGSSSSEGLDNLAADASTPSGQAIGREEAEAIRQALERLPDDYRRVLRLRYEEDRPFEEIGSLMGLTANAARKLWVRAVHRLQQEIGPTP